MLLNFYHQLKHCKNIMNMQTLPPPNTSRLFYSIKVFRRTINGDETWVFNKQTNSGASVLAEPQASVQWRASHTGPVPRAFNHSDSDIPSPSPSEWPLLGGGEIFMSGAFAHTPMRLPSRWYTARWTQRWSLPVHLLLIFGPSPDPWKCSCELYRTSLMQAADTTHRRLPIMLICYSWSTWPHILQSAFNGGMGPSLFKRISHFLWESAIVSGQMLGLEWRGCFLYSQWFTDPSNKTTQTAERWMCQNYWEKFLLLTLLYWGSVGASASV